MPVLALAAPAAAQSIQVAPVSIELGPEQRVATIAVTNRRDQPATFQVRPFVWTAENNGEQLTPTDRLAASPPLAEVQPSQTQTVRLMLRQAPGEREGAFRILIDQLPPTTAAGTIRIGLRLSIPVFAKPATAANPDLQWQIRLGHGHAILSVQNRGTRHARLTQADLIASGMPPVAAPVASNPYVLPGAQREWPLAPTMRLSPGSAIRIRATSNLGPIESAVSLVPMP